MKILADMHISPLTIECLRGCGHDVIRVPEVLPATALDAEIVATAAHQDRAILTQDLDYSDLIALSGSRSRTREFVVIGSLFLSDAHIHCKPM